MRKFTLSSCHQSVPDPASHDQSSWTGYRLQMDTTLACNSSAPGAQFSPQITCTRTGTKRNRRRRRAELLCKSLSTSFVAENGLNAPFEISRHSHYPTFGGKLCNHMSNITGAF